MILTKQKIVDRINRMQTSFRVNWDDIVDDLDMAIDKINDYMGTRYPPVSSILNDYSDPEKTYSYRSSGRDLEFFPNKYFMNIVIPYVLTQILARDEEFTSIYSKYSKDVDDNLLTMVANELHNVPAHLIDIPKGVYFQNPDPLFKQNPEGWFNRNIVTKEPKFKIEYIPNIPYKYMSKGFLNRAFVKDNNFYEYGTMIKPAVLHENEYTPMLIDEEGSVIGVFIGWSYSPSGETLPSETVIEIKEDIKLYAIWNFEIIRFRYIGNTGTLANWKPLYINKNQIPKGGVTPHSGTAFKLGYQFIGFDPSSYNVIDTTGPDDEPDGHFSEQELEKIRDASEEETIIFKAQWQRVDYKIKFMNVDLDVWNINGKKSNEIFYRYGDEFELPIPEKKEPGNPDLFLGWYDNPAFRGSSITKIFESDYGDKTFYARFESKQYLIRLFGLDGNLLAGELKNLGASLKYPDDWDLPDDLNLDKTVFRPEDEAEMIMKFDKFVDKFTGEEMPERVYKDQDFVASYHKDLEMMWVEINIKYKTSTSGDYESISRNVLKNKKHKLQELLELIPEDGREYDGYYAVGFKDAITPEDIITNDIQFNLSRTLKVVYSNIVTLVTIKHKKIEDGSIEIDEGVTSTFDFVAEGSLEAFIDKATEATSELGKNELEDDKNNKTYSLVGFKKLNALDEEVEINHEFIPHYPSGITIVPVYSEEQTETRTLTVYYKKEKFHPKSFQFKFNEEVNLENKISPGLNEREWIVSSFYSDLDLTDAINDDITMDRDKVVYAKMFSEERIRLILNGTNKKVTVNFYREDILNIDTGQNFTTNISYSSTGGKVPWEDDEDTTFFSGWSEDKDAESGSFYVHVPITSLMKEVGDPDLNASILEIINLYPIQKTRPGYKVNISLMHDGKIIGGDFKETREYDIYTANQESPITLFAGKTNARSWFFSRLDNMNPKHVDNIFAFHEPAWDISYFHINENKYNNTEFPLKIDFDKFNLPKYTEIVINVVLEIELTDFYSISGDLIKIYIEPETLLKEGVGKNIGSHYYIEVNRYLQFNQIVDILERSDGPLDPEKITNFNKLKYFVETWPIGRNSTNIMGQDFHLQIEEES